MHNDIKSLISYFANEGKGDAAGYPHPGGIGRPDQADDGDVVGSLFISQNTVTVLVTTKCGAGPRTRSPGPAPSPLARLSDRGSNAGEVARPNL